MTSDREKQLLERIRELEELNSTLQDKLDLIYEIVAPADAPEVDFDDDFANGEATESGSLVNIKLPKN